MHVIYLNSFVPKWVCVVNDISWPTPSLDTLQRPVHINHADLHKHLILRVSWCCPEVHWAALTLVPQDSQRLWYHTWRWNECPWVARFHFARPPAVGLLFAHRTGKTKAWGFLARKLCRGVDEKGELLRVITHQGESREYGDQERELYGPTIWALTLISTLPPG